MNDLQEKQETSKVDDVLLRKTLSSSMTAGKVDNYISERAKLLVPIDAVLDFKLFGFDGKLKCHPTDTKKYPYKWEHRVYGAGLIDVDNCKGTLSTGYTSWDKLWADTTSAGVTAGEAALGVVLVVFFRKDGTPIGDFRGMPSGKLGLGGAGGDGGWEKI
ncbi:conserved hypothetical protein [Flavobacterium sp. 9AF]|uniref:hypothetical protein n=1 Tax=Flavobacterium sp. 9AF TaxID=2653142 RepID=UPI0012F3D0A2|nr:hypothetical protein [Flavobacterium sp. 9AF]VXC39204.1 conserved hypothetical protein [Flavobacterium sp. 9AF]